MLKQKFIYFASYCEGNNKKWHSPGANKKIKQTISFLKKFDGKIIFLNFTPKESKKIFKDMINICSSNNPLKYRLEILFSVFKNKNLFKFGNKNLVVVIYNATLNSLLFYFSLRINRIKPKLIVQVEDLPLARESNTGLKGWFDKISFAFLIKRSYTTLFASKTMLDRAYKEYKFNCPSYIYPPSLSENYLDIMKKRKEPFSSENLIIMYAGSFLKEKGIFNLIEAFLKSDLKKSILHLYGSNSEEIKSKYKNIKSIKFFGIVNDSELYKAYSKADIVVNPHLKVKNNSFIFPCKNIEILASGALPLFSHYSFVKEPSLNIPKTYFYKSNLELVELLNKSKDLWLSESKQIKKISLKIRRYFSRKNIENKIFDKIIL